MPSNRPPNRQFRANLIRHLFNFYPCYWGSGGRITYISADFRHVEVRLKLGWRTRNYVGTIFGGSLFGAIDPIYMIMLIDNLGPEFMVFDQAARVEFRRPGRGTIHARLQITQDDLDSIHHDLAAKPSLQKLFVIEWIDSEGQIVCWIEKTIYIRRRPEGKPVAEPWVIKLVNRLAERF